MEENPGVLRRFVREPGQLTQQDNKSNWKKSSCLVDTSLERAE